MPVITWVLSSLFKHQSLVWAIDPTEATKRTFRNVLNDGRIYWEHLAAMMALCVIKLIVRVVGIWTPPSLSH